MKVYDDEITAAKEAARAYYGVGVFGDFTMVATIFLAGMLFDRDGDIYTYKDCFAAARKALKPNNAEMPERIHTVVSMESLSEKWASRES